MPRLLAAVLAACAAALAVVRAGATQSDMDILLRRVADYVSVYEREMSGVVAEETYVQQTSGAGPEQSRRSRADIVVILLNESAGWVAFRDVFEVNGHPLRDREDRLARLFARPDQDNMARAREIVAESSRFNINPPGIRLPRTINVPFITLKFVRASTQSRSSFEQDRVSGRGGRARLRFSERARPRMIETPDGAAANGWLIVDVSTGRIEETELVIRTGDTRATYHTVFAPQAGFDLWLPASMDETYAVTPLRQVPRQLDARATYTNFRTFGVSVSTGPSLTN